MRETKPTLLLFDDLIEPIEIALKELDSIYSKHNSFDKEEYILKGTFVYVISLFESSITECLKRYLIAFPSEITDGKVTGKESKYVADTIFASDIIEFIIDDFIQKYTYESVNEIMSRTFKLLGVDSKKIKFDNKGLIEKKERRNILVHNNLKIDKKYIRITKCEPNRIRKQLEISNDYIIETIELIQGILSKFRNELSIKYSQYNRSQLLRSVWGYVFDSELLKYDDYWNESSSFIFENKKKFDINWLSSGEKTMLAYWIQHYSPGIVDRYFKFEDMNMAVYSMKRMNFLVEFFNKYPFILQHG